MSQPKRGSQTYEVLKALHVRGPMYWKEISALFPMMKRGAWETICAEYALTRSGGKWVEASELKRFFDREINPVSVTKELGEIVPSRTPTPFKPYVPPTAIRREPLREISFITSGTAPYRHL